VSWSDATIGDYVRVEHGFAFKGEYFSYDGEYVVLTPGNFHEAGGFRERVGKDRFYQGKFPDRYLLKRGDLVVAMTEQGEGLLGSAALVPADSKYLHNQRLGLVKERPAIADRRFFYYLFNTGSVRQQIRNSSSGAKVRHTSPERIYGVQVRVPDKVTQSKISAILSAYDDLIENNRRRIALLEKMAEEIYREWFVRMRFPGHEQAKFEKGVPEGWKQGIASTFFGHVKGKSYGGDELTERSEDMPFITLKSFNRGGGYRAEGLKRYSGKFKDEQVVHQGDVVMAVTDMTQNREVVGRVARVPDLGEKGAVISLDVIKLVPKRVSASYLYSYMRLSGFGEFIKEFANGTNVLHLKPELVVQQRLVMPPKALQDKFVAIVEPIYAQIDALNKAIDHLVPTRDMLLPRLISGKLPVENLDIHFPPSMQEASG
jgi:type I restriction enzyme S subunit